MLMIYDEFSLIQKEVFHSYYLQFKLFLGLLLLHMFICAQNIWYRFIFNLENRTNVLSANVTIGILQVNLA